MLIWTLSQGRVGRWLRMGWSSSEDGLVMSWSTELILQLVKGGWSRMDWNPMRNRWRVRAIHGMDTWSFDHLQQRRIADDGMVEIKDGSVRTMDCWQIVIVWNRRWVGKNRGSLANSDPGSILNERGWWQIGGFWEGVGDIMLASSKVGR